MKKIFTLFLIVVFCIIMPLTVSAKDQKYVMRFSHGLPPNHPIVTGNFNYFKDLVEKNSKGAITVKMFPSGQLVNDKEVLKSVKSGAIEACAAYTCYIKSVIPSMGVFTVPMLFNDQQAKIDAVKGKIGKYLFAELKKKNYMALGWIAWPNDIFGIEMNSSVHVPEDLKGKVIRPTSREAASYFKEYGHSQVAYVSGAELYTAMQRGVVDGAVATFQHAVARKLSEVAPYFCVLPGIAVNDQAIIVNQKFYAKLPVELQKVLLDAGEKTQERSYKVAEQITIDMTKKAKACMKEIYYPTEDEMKLWIPVDINDFYQRVLKDDPATLKLIMDYKNS